jgi:hypothetical protein
MSANPFLIQFKSYSDIELFEILSSKDQYQPQAVEAAWQELNLRDLSTEAWAQLEKHYRDKQERITQKQSNSPQLVLSKKAANWGERLNPFTRSGVDKDIAMIMLSISFFMVFSLVIGYSTLVQTLINFSFRTDDILQLFPFILIPPALYFFYKRDVLGWIILSVWTIYNIISLFPIIPWAFGVRKFYFLYQPADVATLLLGLIIFSSMLVALNRVPVREALKVTRRTQYATILFSIFLTGMLILK